MKATVRISLKPGVLDPEGQAIENALKGLGFASVGDVRQSKLIEVSLNSANADDAEKEVRAMCEKLLANPVMETFEIEIQS